MEGAAAAAGSVAGSLIGLVGGREANESNSHAMQLGREFSVWNSLNRHQMETRDLVAAGLNPILSANSGASAMTPPALGAQNTMEGVASAAKEIPMMLAQLKKLKEDTNLSKALAAKVGMETTVAAKGIPEAEAKNLIWDKVKELGKSILPKESYQKGIQQNTGKFFQGDKK